MVKSVEAQLEELRESVTVLSAALHQEKVSLKRQIRQGFVDPDLAGNRDLIDLGNVLIIKAHQTSGQSVDSSSWTTITLDTLDVDATGAGSDLTNNQFTIRRSGFYLVCGLVSFVTNATNQRYAGFSVDNAASPTVITQTAPGNSNASVRMSFAVPYSLNVGQTIELMGWQNSGGAINTNSGTSNSQCYLALYLLADN